MASQLSFLSDSSVWLEEDFQKQGYQFIVGVDEVGRGPLAGPVVAASVFLPPNSFIEGLTDSKKLTEKKREALFPIIHELAWGIGVGYVSSPEIDQINILQASLKAMKLSLGHLLQVCHVQPEVVLVDGNQVFETSLPCHAIVKGDSRSLSIAAASVVAKVIRDRMMDSFDSLYPLYGFSSHKGYPSAKHKEAIAIHGSCPLHRLSFRGVLPEKSSSNLQEESSKKKHPLL